MRKLKRYGAALLLAISTVFQSCNDDDRYSIGDLGVDWVTVHVEGDGAYSFIGDRWGTMSLRQRPLLVTGGTREIGLYFILIRCRKIFKGMIMLLSRN